MRGDFHTPAPPPDAHVPILNSLAIFLSTELTPWNFDSACLCHSLFIAYILHPQTVHLLNSLLFDVPHSVSEYADTNS